ncbi:MAG TPA: LysR family transcriptional regulator [Pyrinomonadaceae bacterium]|jgi:DNA-binding transcriptional LysR family regulator
MNFQQLQYFLALADELHFWRTSEKLFITQSALSRHIRTIEDELGIQLFKTLAFTAECIIEPQANTEQ